MGINSYAQNFEDVLLWRALGNIPNGFYIDVGAQDPIIDSVSRAFYEHGWRGIHIEATPQYAQLLRENRPDETVLQVALSNQHGMITFYEIPETGISTGDKSIAQEHIKRGFTVQEIIVPCMTLSEIFDQIGSRDIHWLKIDVEGFERQVLDGWGISNIRPWIVVVESTLPLSTIESHEKWEYILLKKQYSPVYFDGLNRYYISSEHSELKEFFNSPPNVFDGFTLNGTASTSMHHLIQKRYEDEVQKVGLLNREIEQLRDESKAQIQKDTQEYREKIIALNDQFQMKESELLSHIENIRNELKDQVNVSAGHLATLATREKEFADELNKVRENENIERRTLESQYQDKIQGISVEHKTLEQELINQIENIRNELKDQVNVSAGHLATLATREKEWNAREHSLNDLIRQMQNNRSTEAKKYLDSLVQNEKEFAHQLSELRKNAEIEIHRIENQHKETITELSNEYKSRENTIFSQIESIHTELKTQTNISNDLSHLLKAAQLLESQLQNELGMRQQILVNLSLELVQMRASLSWRITAPFRTVRALFSSSSNMKVPLRLREDFTQADQTMHEVGVKTQSQITDYQIDSLLLSEVDSSLLDETISMQDLKSKELESHFKEIFMPSSSITPAISIDELITYHDADFVQCAYITLLGRAPDSEGMRYYIGRLRSGHPKIAIVDQLVSSPEWKSRNSKVIGLQQAVKIYRIRKIPIVGGIWALLYGHSSQSIIEKKLSITENQIYLNHKDCLKKIEWLEKNLISIRKDIKNTLNIANISQPEPDLENKVNGGKIYIDITTLMKWNRPPVGIIRVLLELVKYSLNNLSTKYYCFNSSRDDMKIIDNEIVLGLVERLSNLHHNKNQTDNNQYFEQIRMLLEFSSQTEVGADDFLPFHDGQLSSLFGAEILIAKNMNSFFESQDTIISVGLDWDSSNYPILHWLKKRIGFTFIGAFYDGIPVVAPHLVQSFGFSQMFFQHIYNLIHLSDKIFSISYFSENQLRAMIDDHHIERVPKIRTIYLGNSEENVLNIEEKHFTKSRTHAKNYAIYVSTIETRKNHKLLLEVWRNMIDLKIPNIPDLVCVGMWGWGIEELREQYFNDKELQQYIHFYDDVDDNELGYLYQHAMFSLFPSFMEGWGLGAVESMTYGIPSIISTTPALVEATQNLMPTADPEHPEEWIIEIRKILSDPQYLDSLRTLIKENFECKTWTTFSSEFYSFVLENK
jgi:FkbM family methyltransferase